MPIYSAFVALAFFAGLGLPALSGFISEALCFIGGFSAFRLVTAIGTLGILLGAVYLLRAYQRVFLGQLNDRCKEYSDINNLELLAVIPLAVVVLLFGVLVLEKLYRKRKHKVFLVGALSFVIVCRVFLESDLSTHYYYQALVLHD